MRLVSSHFILLTCYTATASPTKQLDIQTALALSDATTTTCRFPTVNPSCYINVQQVVENPPSTFWAPIVLRTRANKRTIIFGNSDKLGSLIPDLRWDIESTTDFRDPKCDVYFRSTLEPDKKRVAAELDKPLCDALIFLFFVSVVLQMGIDCRDVGLVISFLHTKSVTDWIQEIGRAGRNGKPSAGFLFYSSAQLGALHMMRPDEKKLHTFLKLCQQDICRRKLLFDAIEELDVNREFPAALHLCCDNCRPKCKCTICVAGKYQFPWPEFGMQRNENDFISRAQSFIGANFNVEFDNKS